MSVIVPMDVVVGFGLVLTRMLGVFLFAPVFGHSVVPVRVRLGLSVAVAWFTAVQIELGPFALDASLAFAVVREATIGLAIGFAASLVFSGFALMAELAAIQGGLGAANAIDPASGANSVVLTSLVGSVALLVFLTIGAHHELLRASVLSFELLPPAGSGPAPAGLGGVAALGGGVFAVAVRLAAPFTAVMLVTNLAVGMLGRAIPQLNLMSLQLPAQIAITLLLLALGAGPLTEAMAGAIREQVPSGLEALVGAR
jgi:flagellar biosynthetic protein FliR